MWIDLQSPNSDSLERTAETFRSGGVVVYPTDTIYGLGCDPFRVDAVKRLYSVKDRSLEKGILLLIPDLSWLSRLCQDPTPLCWRLARRFWPGPLTLLVRPGEAIPPELIGQENKLGLRLPSGAFLKELLRALDFPIVSTSANLSGQPPLFDPEALERCFADKVDLIVTGELTSGPPSTVVDVSGREPRIVRAGSLAAEASEFLKL